MRISVILLSLCSFYTTWGQEGKVNVFDRLSSYGYYPIATGGFQTLKGQSVNAGLYIGNLSEHCNPLGKGIGFNNEFIFKNSNGDFVYSPQLSLFLTSRCFYAGTKLSYSTNFRNGGRLDFIPEVGAGFSIFFIVYGYSINLIKNTSIPVNTHSLSIKVLLPIT